MATSNSANELTKDRISNLPDGIIHNICSFLDMRRVVQTSVLSTRWKDIWKSLPFLNFNYFDGTTFHNYPAIINLVNKVLGLRDRNSDIQSFHLDYSISENLVLCPEQFCTWIREIVRCNAQEIDINIYSDKQLSLPYCLFTCKSLKILNVSIHGWTTTLRPNFLFGYIFLLPDFISFPNLKAMYLNKLRFSDEKLVTRFFSGCHVLKILTIEDCEIGLLQNFVISAPKLKHLVLRELRDSDNIQPHGYCKIKIYAPELVSFEFKGEFGFGSGYHIESCPALTNADIDIFIKEYVRSPDFKKAIANRKTILDQRAISCLKSVRDARALKLSKTYASFIEFLSEPPSLLEGQLLVFLNLKYLELNTWLSRNSIHAILYLLNLSPNIETLVLSIEKGRTSVHHAHPRDKNKNLCSECMGDEEVKSLRFVLHHLKYVEMKHVIGCVNELKFLEILLVSGVVLETIAVYSYGERSLNKFKQKLLRCSQASSSVEILIF